MEEETRLSEAQVRDVLATVNDPELHRPITDLDMVRAVLVNEGRVRLSIALTVPGCPLKATIERDVTNAVRSLGADDVRVEFTVMTDEERTSLAREILSPRTWAYAGRMSKP